MTKHPIFLALGAITLAAASLSPLQAQGLKPSSQLNLPRSSALAGTPGSGPQRQADFIVAVVNSEPITNNEVRSKLVRAEQLLSQQGTPMPPRSELVRQVLERLIGDKAQLQLAKASSIKVDDNAVDAAVQNVAQQNQLSVAELNRRLQQDGIALGFFRGEIRDEILVSRLRQREIEARVMVTEQDIDTFLREQDNNTDPSAVDVNLAQVLVVVPENATPAQVAALQARAQTAADRARAGQDFAAVVNEFSELSTRASGGQMGLRNANRYPALFLEATQNLRAGGIAGPIRSDAGFHVLKVVEKKQAGLPGVSVTQTRARHILLRLSPQLTEEAARAKLLDIKQRILNGQGEFAALARSTSDDGSAKEGGDLGWANPGQFVPEFEQVMDSLAPGRIADPLTSRFGVHLIQVMERRETKLSTREQRELVRATLREKKQEEAYSRWAEEVRGQAYVEYREPPQ